MKENTFNIDNFLDIIYELERFSEQYIEKDMPIDYKRKVMSNMEFIKKVFCEIFIIDFQKKNKQFIPSHFDSHNLIRDVIYLYTYDHFEKKEVLYFLENVDNETVLEMFYQRI
jgi:hypothetical protein